MLKFKFIKLKIWSLRLEVEPRENICAILGIWVCKLKTGPGQGWVYPIRTGKLPHYVQLCLREYAN